MSLFDWFRRSKSIPPAPQPDIVLPPLPPPSGRIASERCIAFIKKTEGLLFKAKPDVDGVYVNGYGCKVIDGSPAFAGQIITEATADRSCRAHVQLCADAVLNLVTRPVSQGQLDALIDFVYNVGSGALKQSTLLRTFNLNQPVTEAMFTVWSKAHIKGQIVTLDGLFQRRKNEYNLFWVQ